MNFSCLLWIVNSHLAILHHCLKKVILRDVTRTRIHLDAKSFPSIYGQIDVRGLIINHDDNSQ
jgi:hypothetical protein